MDKITFNCVSGDGATLEVGFMDSEPDPGEGMVWVRTKGGRPVHLTADQVSDLRSVLALWQD